jgi:DNA-3-methyladenine glycosylase II
MERSTNECLYRVHKGSIYKCHQINDETVLFRVCEGENGTLQVEFVNTLPKKSTRILTAKFVWNWFDLETDLRPFYSMAENDPLLKSLVQNYFGLRIVGVEDLFEALCWAIMGQQINLTFAYTLKRRFVESFGEKITYKDQDYWLFPRPEIIADLSIDDLAKLQFTRRKSEYIIGMATLMKNGILSKQNLLHMNDFKQAEKELIKIKGIGPWTANYVLLRCLKDPSAFPIEDVGIHNAIKQQLKMAQKPSIEEIQQLSSGWGNWKAYATFYLWRSLIE